jgi:hypothetical protein
MKKIDEAVSKMKLENEVGLQQMQARMTANLNQAFANQPVSSFVQPNYTSMPNMGSAQNASAATAPISSLRIVIGSTPNPGSSMSCTRDSGGHVTCQSASKFKS